MFQQITIIGLGLIGSSLARAIRANNLAERVVASDRDQAVCDIIVNLGLADEATTNNRKSVIGSDLVIIAVPQGAYSGIAGEISPALKPGAIVTDTGSVKKAAIDALLEHLPGSVHLVAGHPIAGTENSGPEAGFAELFHGRWCILTPMPDCDIRAVEKITNFWEACGARIEVMEPEHHDLVLGITSHLPHLIAFTIVDTAKNLEDDIRSEVIKYSASGFRGFTRIAASDPVMWRDVFLNNRPAVLEMLQRFTEDLTAMQKAIRRGDGDYLFEVFSRTRSIRRHISEMGPEGLPAPAEKISQ
jgi:cyclohexadieny/prephenate dehydrogenase